MDDFCLLPEELSGYIEGHTSPVEPLLSALDRDTHVNVLCPRMLSGAYQGKLLEFLSRMISPERILEVGTYTGYSAICLAKGLKEGGRLLTIEHNPELEERIRAYLGKAGMSGIVELKIGEAADLLPALPEAGFDLVFLDADKAHYAEYYPMLKRVLKPGGWLLIDNVLWNGKVWSAEANDKDTRVLRDLNRMVSEDPDVENVLLPVRDGINIVRKL